MVKVVRRDRPRAAAASNWPLGTVLKAPSQIWLENAANTRLKAIIAATKGLIATSAS
ncbi:hypothetical protein D3C71_1902090 [compost metagenome]